MTGARRSPNFLRTVVLMLAWTSLLAVAPPTSGAVDVPPLEGLGFTGETLGSFSEVAEQGVEAARIQADAASGDTQARVADIEQSREAGCTANDASTCMEVFEDLSRVQPKLAASNSQLAEFPQVTLAGIAVYGQAGTGGTPVGCVVGAATGTPDTDYGNFRYIGYSGSVWCPSGGRGNISIHITDVSLVDATTNLTLASGPPWGPYMQEGEGGTTGGFYTRRTDTQLQYIKVRAYMEIVGGATGSGNGWHVVPSGCVAESRLKVRCDVRSPAFAFVPTPHESDSAPMLTGATAIGGVGDVDDGEEVGRFFALPGGLTEQVESGAMTFAEAKVEAAALQSPVIECNASISKKIGGVGVVYPLEPDLQLRKVLWWVRHTCVGAAALAFRGNPDLVRGYDLGYLLQYGAPYNAAIGSGPDGRIRLIERNHWYEPVPPRRSKRVKWHSTIELPSPYSWLSDDPLTGQRFVDGAPSGCDRSSNTYPSYLNLLKCTLYSYRFK